MKAGRSQNRPEWMVLECIPVVPIHLRPRKSLGTGDFVPGDLNELYRRVIHRNLRLKKLLGLNAPEVIIRNEKRMLQQSVDALFDNGRCSRPLLNARKRPLQSLTARLQGFQGSFRKNLRDKRVDYSARSVIVPGPDLKLHQCGLPRKIALELFQPFIIRRLRELGRADTVAAARQMLGDASVWDILAEIMKNHPVLLNRSGKLSRTRIQAFEPVLIEGNAIRIHPLVCAGFKANFDGDRMIVHLPLSSESQTEAAVLLAASNNLFSPVDGTLLMKPTRDIVLGCHYLTVDPLAVFTSPAGVIDERIKDWRKRLPENRLSAKDGESCLPSFAETQNLKGEGMMFFSPAEMFLAYSLNKVGIHARIRVRLPIEKRVIREAEMDKTRVEEIPRNAQNLLVWTTVGRVLFNDILKPAMAYYDLALSSEHLCRIIDDCYRQLGRGETIGLLDRIKTIGFRTLTHSGLSLSMDDLRTPADKEAVLAGTDKSVALTQRQYEKGFICPTERYNHILDLWTTARDNIGKQVLRSLHQDVRAGLPNLNPLMLMARSGVCSSEQIRQLSGMVGLTARRTGSIRETPIRGNFREGLSVLDFFMLADVGRGTRINAAVKRPADRAYLTRKLIDAVGDVVVSMHDCGTRRGIGVGGARDPLEPQIVDVIQGRVSSCRIDNARTGETLVGANDFVTREQANGIVARGIDRVLVRSPMTCEAPRGVCQLCYGMDLTTRTLVEPGTAVGVIAAQAIGGFGSSVKMPDLRDFQTLVYRIVEKEHQSKRAGIVKFIRINPVVNEQGETVALSRDGQLQIHGYGGLLEEYAVANGALLFVREGQRVEPRTKLCEWDPYRATILAEQGGRIRFEDVKEGETFRKERDASGAEWWVVIEHNGALHPRIVIETDGGYPLNVYYLPQHARLDVTDGQQVAAGTVLARTPRPRTGTWSMVGKPQLFDWLEVRHPRNPAVIAQIAGRVEIGEPRKDKRVIIVEEIDANGEPTGSTVEHLVPRAKYLPVYTGDYVKAGDRLVDGAVPPHDLMLICGVPAVQQYLLREMRLLFRSQYVAIDDRHLEIVIRRMLGKVRVASAGDTGLVPGALLDRGEFEAINQRVRREGNQRRATAHAQLLGITKAAIPSHSFLAAAAYSMTSHVLAAAALAGRVDPLLGLKENLILGRPVPVGTGHPYRNALSPRETPHD